MKHAPSPPSNPLLRTCRSFVYAARGCRILWREEFAFRVEMAVLLLAIAAALWLGETRTERALLILVAAQVPVFEAVNSAIEATVDRISQQRHPLAAKAKDLAACAVAFSILLAAGVWTAILLPRWLPEIF